MEDLEYEPRLLFEIEGVPRRRGLKKLKSFISITENDIFIELDGETDFYSKNVIFDIYIKEPIVEDVTSRTTVIEFFEEGEQGYYELEDATFPSLSYQIEKILNNEWSYILEKHKYSDTIKWFNACNAIVNIVAEQNYLIFGGADKNPDTMNAQRKVLYDTWQVNTTNDLKTWLDKLYNGRAVKDYDKMVEKDSIYTFVDEDLIEAIAQAGGSKCLWAWDLQRMILLASLGYLCDYLSWDEAIEYCFEAGLKLQRLYHNWDEFINCYLLGYYFWSEEDLNDETSEGNERKQIYDYYKKLNSNPWQIAWNLELNVNS